MLLISIFSCIIILINVSKGGPIFWMNNQVNLLPEAMRYYDELGFLTGSMGYGTIFQMNINTTSMSSRNPMNFTATPFFSNEDLQFSNGFEIDFDRNVLFICHSNPATFSSASQDYPSALNFSLMYDYMSGIMIVNLTSMEIIINFDFADYNIANDTPTYHLANDIVIDYSGNAYITDSFGGVIYRINYDSNDTVIPYDLEIFSYDIKWQQDPYNYFFDGLSLDPMNESYLLVNCWLNGFGGTSVFYKVLIDDPMDVYMVNYTNIASIQYGFDGQILSDDGMYLYVTGDSTQTVYQFTSDDDWDTATLIQSLHTQYMEPTSIQFATSGVYGTDIIDSVYVSSALFSEYGASSFPIELIDFTRNNTIIINNTCNDSNDSDDDDDIFDDEAMIMVYSLGGLSVILIILLIISIVCICKLKKSIAYVGSNLDYQNLNNNYI